MFELFSGFLSSMGDFSRITIVVGVEDGSYLIALSRLAARSQIKEVGVGGPHHPVVSTSTSLPIVVLSRVNTSWCMRVPIEGLVKRCVIDLIDTRISRATHVCLVSVH
jgi:hypothetical protein